MKIRTKNNRNNKKLLKIVGIVIAAILLVVAVSFLIGLIVYNQQGKQIESLLVSSYPEKLVYYVGDDFDPKGLEIQVIYKNGESTFISNTSKLTLEGFDSTEVCDEQQIKVSYNGVSTTISVVIVELPKPTPTLESIEVYDLKTTYDFEYWNTYGLDIVGSMIKLRYSDGSEIDDYLLAKYISGVRTVSTPGTLDITVRYSDGVKTVETTVTITITK